MKKLRDLLKLQNCSHEIRRVHHDFARMKATITCNQCGEELTVFELREQADAFQLAGDGE